jgi:hypothetical protein
MNKFDGYTCSVRAHYLRRTHAHTTADNMDVLVSFPSLVRLSNGYYKSVEDIKMQKTLIKTHEHAPDHRLNALIGVCVCVLCMCTLSKTHTPHARTQHAHRSSTGCRATCTTFGVLWTCALSKTHTHAHFTTGSRRKR